MPATRPEGIALLLLLFLGPVGCGDDEAAITRGDRLWADSSFSSALAEYRLAASQRDDAETLARLAHAFAVSGALPEARETYERLVSGDASYREQAVYDLLGLADRALARNDPHSAAVAMDAALELRPGLTFPRGVTRVASFYAERGQVEEALRYYRLALAALPPDSAAALLFEIGRLEEERGRCAAAIDYFSAFRDRFSNRGRRWVPQLSEARWHTGSCAFQLALEARESGQDERALDYLATVIRLGEPENMLDQAWFERGELLRATGAAEEALEAYRRVLQRNPSRSGRLVERAQQRIDEIRFGGLSTDGTPPRGRPIAPVDTGGTFPGP